jgi:DNA modification methylase
MNRFELGKAEKDEILCDFVPAGFPSHIAAKQENPMLAKDLHLMANIQKVLSSLPTFHHFHLGDSVLCPFPSNESVHLVLTSPPYWTLKRYNEVQGQLGHEKDYTRFLAKLNTVWEKCFECLVPGGRLITVVGDVCLSRRENNGRHVVVPLHAAIQESCGKIGFDNLAPIIWHKIANARYESGGGGFLGKPYEPNCIIKNDIEYILMFRKPGGYRHPTDLERRFSVISSKQHQKWFQQIWFGVTGASTKAHPAPYPEELAMRLIKMFSFAGDVAFDPFLGLGTTTLAAWKSGRNSVGIEVDPAYLKQAVSRLQRESAVLTSNHSFQIYGDSPIL